MSHGRAAPGRPVPHPALPQQRHFLPWQPRGARRGRGSAEPRGGINIAKPPEAPRAPGLCPAATARFTPCATGHRHWHRAGAALQQLAEPRQGGGVKCRVINTRLANALHSRLQVLAGSCRAAARGCAPGRGSGEVISACRVLPGSCAATGKGQAHVGMSHMAWTFIPWREVVCSTLSSWGGQSLPRGCEDGHRVGG